jgi:hypothetical protein
MPTQHRRQPRSASRGVIPRIGSSLYTVADGDISTDQIVTFLKQSHLESYHNGQNVHDHLRKRRLWKALIPHDFRLSVLF